MAFVLIAGDSMSAARDVLLLIRKHHSPPIYDTQPDMRLPGSLVSILYGTSKRLIGLEQAKSASIWCSSGLKITVFWRVSTLLVCLGNDLKRRFLGILSQILLGCATPPPGEQPLDAPAVGVSDPNGALYCACASVAVCRSSSLLGKPLLCALIVSICGNFFQFRWGVGASNGSEQLGPVLSFRPLCSFDSGIPLTCCSSPGVFFPFFCLLICALFLFFTLILSHMASRTLVFHIPSSAKVEELKALCRNLGIKVKGRTKMEYVAAVEKRVYESTSAAKYHDLPVLQGCWWDPVTSSQVVWSPLSSGEKLVLVAGTEAILNQNPFRSSQSQSSRMASQPSQADDSQIDLSQNSTDDALEYIQQDTSMRDSDLAASPRLDSAQADLSPWATRGELELLRRELMLLKSQSTEAFDGVNSLADDVAACSSAINDCEDACSKVETLATSHKNIASTVNLLTKEYKTRWGKYDKEMETVAATIAAAREAVESVGKKSAKMEEDHKFLVNTVEVLDSRDRSKNLIITGFPINYNCVESDPPPPHGVVAVADATAFLMLVGITENHWIGQFHAIRRPVRDVKDRPVLPAGVRYFPPLIVSFENAFKAQAVLQQYIAYSKAPENSGVTFRARVDTTWKEREMAKQVGEVVNALRDDSRGQGIDARYRPGGKIAIFINNSFSHFLDKAVWPRPAIRGGSSMNE